MERRRIGVSLVCKPRQCFWKIKQGNSKLGEDFLFTPRMANQSLKFMLSDKTPFQVPDTAWKPPSSLQHCSKMRPCSGLGRAASWHPGPPPGADWLQEVPRLSPELEHPPGQLCPQESGANSYPLYHPRNPPW